MENTNNLTEPRPARSGRVFWRTGFRIALALILLAVLLQFVEPDQIAAAFAAADGFPIALAAALVVFNLGFQILKWYYLLLVSDARFPLARVARSLFFGITVGTLTPGQIGEFGGRAFHLASDHPERIVGLTIVDKLQMLVIMAIGGGISLSILFHLNLYLNLLLILVLMFILALLLRPTLLVRILEQTGLGRVKNAWIREFLAVVSAIQKPRTIAVSVFLTILFYATIWIQLYFLLNAFTPVTLEDSFLGFAAMMLAKSALPFTFADLGTREIGLVYFLSLRFVPEAAALNAGLLLFAINILTPALIGLLFIPRSFSLRTRR